MYRITAALLAGLALSTLAYASGPEIVADPQACPAGTTDVSANYEWADGHLVRNGWSCESRSVN
jgi:hypothetical protein